MVRPTVTQKEYQIPENVHITVKNRIVTVKGDKGTVIRDFKHMPITLEIVNGGKTLRGSMFLAKKKTLAALRSAISRIETAALGVTHGYEYKMLAVHYHFRMDLEVTNNNRHLTIGGFLHTINKHIEIPQEWECEFAKGEFDNEIFIRGIDKEQVSQIAASVSRSCRVGHLDNRKFLDGLYVENKRLMED
ncbi:hypothetical protein PCE1_002340 [Barthelona sp. PCE]